MCINYPCDTELGLKSTYGGGMEWRGRRTTEAAEGDQPAGDAAFMLHFLTASEKWASHGLMVQNLKFECFTFFL